jgi:RNA polymerase subunit RPABC4/transcription elongation factor Spt4
MTLSRCKACDSDVGRSTKNCPKCGEKLKRDSVAIIIAAFQPITGPQSSQPKKISEVDATSIPHANNTIIKPHIELTATKWMYSKSADELSGKPTYSASVKSSNFVNFSSPYNGSQGGTLTLRTHPKYGKNVIFRIEKGQILCSTFDGCAINVQFGNKEAVSFRASTAADHSNNIIFINNYSSFVKLALSVNEVSISPEIYLEGSPVFTFDVSDFKQDLYKPD